MKYSLSAGVSRNEINPVIGVRLCGSLRDGLSSALHDDLYVSALYLSTQTSCVLIIAADCIIFSLDEANQIRSGAAVATGLSVEQVFLNLSHTHAVPAPPSFNEFDSESEPDQFQLNQEYFEKVKATVKKVAVNSQNSCRPAVISASSGSAKIGINRREELPDGTLILGENPLGAYDDTVGVVRIDEANGQPLACLVHASCHPDILGPKSSLISPDFVGPMRRFVEKQSGALTFFIQGCCADIDPISGIVNGEDAVRETERLGLILGSEVFKVYNAIGPLRARKERVEWRSQNSVVTGWNYGEPELLDSEISTASAVISLPLKALPPVKECQDFNREAKEAWDTSRTLGMQLSDQLVARRRYIWSEIQMAEALKNGGDLSFDLPIHAMSIGPIILIGIPAEVFTEIGTQIREQLSEFAELVLVSGYSNGVHFYIPTARAFEFGGYEVNSHRNYLKPSGPTKEWESAVVKNAVDLVRRMLGQQSYV